MTQQIPKDIAEDSLVPIIVGVTGHTFAAEEKISEDNKNEIDKVFKDLDRKYPNTPIVMLSPLAEGADRLVANLALNTKRRNGTSISLICPLPMPQSEYEKDFKEEESKETFRIMLGKASASFVLPMAKGSTSENIQNENLEPRKRQYEQAGKYIAQHSHILIALWNGQEKPDFNGIGGTSQIVKKRHEGNLVLRRHLDEIDNVPIYCFPTTQISKDKVGIQPRREIFPGMTLNPPANTEEKDKKILKQGQETIRRVFERMEMFNSDIKSMSDKNKKKIGKNKGYVIPCEECADLTEMSRRVLHHYAIADTLAIHFQWWSDKTLLSLFIIVLIAFAFFELYAHLKMSYFFLTGYPLGLGIAVFIFRYATTRIKVQSKYLDYRALAEGLRVQFFWMLAARTEEVVEFYLRKQKSELDWIKYAIRSFNMPFSDKEYKEKQEMEKNPKMLVQKRLRVLVLTHWVKDQAGYFTNKTAKEKARLEKQHDRGKFFFILGVSFAVVLFLLQLCVVPNPDPDHLKNDHFWEYVDHGFLIAIGLAIAVTAAIAGYTEKMAISAQAKRYAWMSGIFNRASTDLDELLNKHKTKDAQDLVSELGKEALEENADWLIIRRERKIEVPTG